ncbi:hypothetical protein TrLO_g3328 [Triparma laevis f. longispina]|nr:hypothetical protein TrLO_g3328 [Triparma laevis f. longispina]
MISPQKSTTLFPPSSFPTLNPSTSLTTLPVDVLTYTLMYLRAYDLSSLQQTCVCFSDRDLVVRVVKCVSEQIYPSSLTLGWKSEKVSGRRAEATTGGFERLRDLEMLVVARVLSRPDAEEGFFVSKAWCKSALKWLEASTPSKKASSSKKKGRIRERRLSNALPPWPNINVDLVCEHGSLVRSSKPRAKRKVIDKKAWKVLRRLYPESKEMSTNDSECLECKFNRLENQRKEQEKQNKNKTERKKVLEVGFVREVFNRTKGVPNHCLASTPTPPLFSSPSPTPLSCGICSSTPTSVVDLPIAPIATPPPQKLPSPTRSLRSWPPLGNSGVTPSKKQPKVEMQMLMPDGVLPPPPVFKMVNLPPPPVFKMASPPTPNPTSLPIPITSPIPFTPAAPPPSPPPYPAYNPPLSAGKYFILPRSYLQSWRHYIRAGGELPDPSSYPQTTCNLHGKCVPPFHLIQWLNNTTPTLLTISQRSNPSLNTVEILTEAEYASLIEKFPKIGSFFQESVTVGREGVKWGEDGNGACFNCEQEGRGKVTVR